MSNTRGLRVAGRFTLPIGLALVAWACEPPASSKKAEDGGEPTEADGEVPDASSEPSTVDAAGPGGGPDAGADAGTAPDGSVDTQDGSVAEADAWVGPPPPPEAEDALCTDAYDSVTLEHPDLIRGSWQFNPGGPYVNLPERGYPCLAFLHDADVRPAMNDPGWTDAANGEFLGFSETSTVPESNYMTVQFRYFRSLVFVPQGAQVSSLLISAFGIDDAVHVELYNARFPEGVSPMDAGPSDPMVGACQGNNAGSWDFKDYIAEGSINAFLVVHADMNPATSTLTEVRIEANGAPIQIVSCKQE